MDDMLKEFVVEALDLATNVEEHLLRLEKHPDDSETLNALFRSFHTIKGGAGFMNLPAMVSACHLTENLFDALRTGKAPVTPTAIEAALQASGFVADQLTALANGTPAESLSAMSADLEGILTTAIEGKTMAAAKPAAAPAVVEASAPVQSEQASDDGIDWYALYKAVVPEGTIAAVITPQAAPAALASAKPAAGEQGAKQNLAPVKEDSIRIDSSKLDALLEVAGESVQAANQASVLLEKLLQFKFEGAAAGLMTTLAETLSRASRYSTELQRATLSTRMQPVGRLFQKFPRLVRELAKDLGKEVELAIEGAETEVDRVVVDSLYDPLVHMLRNSLDHGIESADIRMAAGKPTKSVISLKAWQEANSVMIELSDDGKGLNAQELRQKAIKKGLINENAAQTDEEAFQLIFLPGFSTKEVASSVSGRGVGMDVVKTAVEKHRGSISIMSTLGAGTRFTIRLPIELSIVPTLLVRTAGTALALPMSVVQRVVQLPDEFQEVGGAPMMRDQGRPIPVRSLGEILGYEPETERIGIVIACPQ
ncbi:MAG: chemotaxis protein CheA, partial [Burkholderiaceae bacterium]